MLQKLKPKNDRGQRHSAAWGKRLSMLLLLLITEAAFAQSWSAKGKLVGKFAPDLTPLVMQAQQGTAANQTVKVIVQYKQNPTATQVSRMQGLGGHVHARLSLVKAAAFTIPVSILPILEADPMIVSVTIDHPMKGLDDVTDAATGMSSAWNAGFDGTGVSVAVIDSGINDSHPDLWNSTHTHSRVLYHQDFTGTAISNTGGAQYDLYGHGTHVAGIIGGNGYLSGGNYMGVAPNVGLVDLRALDANGSGSDRR